MTEVASTFQRKPCYRYIRDADKLPTHVPNGTALDKVKCKVRLFNPTGIGTWWIASYQPETGNVFGVAELHQREVGTFWLPELVEFRGRFGLPIERDLYWKPQTVAELMGVAE